MSDDGKSADRSSPPALPPESPGSSVSTRMQEEYTELLKFAITTGLQQNTNAEENVTTELEEALKPIASVDAVPSTEEGRPDDGFAEQETTCVNVEPTNTNSNNIYHDSSNESINGDIDRDESNNAGSVHSSAASLSRKISVGPDVSEMGDKLDSWLGRLKGDILAELSRAVLKSFETKKKEHEQEIKDLVLAKKSLEREATRLAEQVNACEQSLQRKDALIENLTEALAASKDKVKVAQVFYTARADSADQRRMTFTEKLAVRHHEHQLVQRVMRGWFGLIQTRWRNRVQKGCEEHAWNVCAQLSQDYEDKIKSLNANIDSLQQKVTFLQQERGQYAEQVRKAFMRGVCALNMETMSAFGADENLDLDPATGHSHPRTAPTGPASYQEDSPDDHLNYSHNASTHLHPHLSTTAAAVDPILGVDKEKERGSVVHHQAPSQPRSLTMPEMTYTSGVIESGTVGIQPRSLPTKSTKVSKTKTRPGTAPSSTSTRHTVRPAGLTHQGQPLAPPMASIVVERHNPVTKQTLGKATAMRYPKSSRGQVSKSQPSSLLGQTFKPLAGQSGSMASIKVVD